MKKSGNSVIQAVLILVVVLTSGCASFGKKPDENQRKAFHSSPNYDPQKERFINRDQEEIDRLFDEVLTAGFFTKRFFAGKEDFTPDEKLQMCKWGRAKITC